MKIKKSYKIALIVVLCLSMILPFLPGLKVDAAEPNFSIDNVGEGFYGKNLSIIGDSISTYAGVSNDATANSTIGSNAVYYTENNSYGVQLEDTWWYQAIDALGMKLCVNNSWSGSRVFTDGGSSNPYKAAWRVDRSQQLHTSSADPDIIAVYLGTNDIKLATSFDGFSANKSTMLSEAAGTSESVMQFSLYIRMINNMMSRYSDAQIYLFTLLPHDGQNAQHRAAMDVFNQSVRDLVTYYQGQSKKVYLVDLYEDTSITTDYNVVNKFLANTLHPNANGMDAITNCFLSSLVKNSGLATDPDNWRDIVYDLTDVYVQGGQINTVRVSGSTDVPIAVDLMPTRPEYDLEVKVEVRKVGTDEWVDITSSSYTGSGQVYVQRVDRLSYDQLKITARAVYQPKNFRWEVQDDSLGSCTEDGNDYHVDGGITYNATALKNGSCTDGVFTDIQYGLADSVLLRNEEPWVVEFKAKGTFGGNNLLFSGTDQGKSANNNYIFFYNGSNGRHFLIGYYMRYSGPSFWNFGVEIPSDVTLDAETSHVYRLVNKVGADGKNMVYFFIDGEEIGEMKNYYIGSSPETGVTDEWLSGRDLEFSFIGAGASYYLNDCGIEYIQVWEGGAFDTTRLRQLIEEYDLELGTSMATATGFTAYQTAINDAKTYLQGLKDEDNSQEKYDALVDAILKARNDLTLSATETKIYGIERISKDYTPIGKPVGLKVITSPDVTKLQVGETDPQTLLTGSSKLQTLLIDGVETEVKVWFVTWLRTATTQKVVQYRVYAYAADTSSAEVSELISIPFGANCLTDLRVTIQPDKTSYVAGESFDATGMQVVAYYGDGSTQKVVTDYTVDKTVLSATDDHVTITYEDATYGSLSVRLPIKVLTNISALGQIEAGTTVTVQGRYVGVASEGMDSDEEILIKDLVTDDIIAVRNVPGNFPNYNYEYGYTVNIIGTVQTDGSSSTPNKRYLDFSYRNGDVDDTIVSMATYMEYNIDDVIEVSSWEEFQALFQVGKIQEYCYIKFTGPLYFQNYQGQDVMDHRLHMNGEAAEAADIKVDGRSVCLREDVMVENLGEDWVSCFSLEDMTGTEYPGSEWNGEMIAVYTGANGSYFQLTILDAGWITPAEAEV